MLFTSIRFIVNTSYSPHPLASQAVFKRMEFLSNATHPVLSCRQPVNFTGGFSMGREQKSNKEVKKKSALTAKEKKAAKKDKKAAKSGSKGLLD